MLIIAIFYLLEMFGIDFKHFLVFTLGVIGLVYATKNENSFLKYISVFLISDGFIHILSVFSLFHQFAYYYLIGIVILLLGFYFISRKRIFIILTAVVVFVVTIISVNSFTVNTNIRYGYWLYCLTFFLIFFFVLEFKKIGYTPLVISIISYLFGTNNLLYGNSVITGNGFKLINLILLLIISISFLIISKIKINREEKDNEQ